MYGRAGLDRFKKAQSTEPFSVASNSAPKMQPAISKALSHPKDSFSQPQVSHQQTQYQNQQVQHHVSQKPVVADVGPVGSAHHVSQNPVVADVGPVGSAQHVTQIGGGQSTWQPPDWAIEPRPGVYYLEVMKDGEVLDRVNLDKRRHIFGRQFHACDFVLDHQSVSRQHAAVIPHKNGSLYVIDLGSAHGTFVANERLTKDSPVELEVGQSLRFAASTRVYILRKDNTALFPPPLLPTEINMPPPPDPSDEESVLAYNTFLNRYGLTKPDSVSRPADVGSPSGGREINHQTERAAKRIRKTRVAFRDQVGGELVEVVGISDGADVETEPGPVGVKEGSLVGKYESLIQTTVIPKGKELSSVKDGSVSQKGVTEKLQQVLNKVKAPLKSGIYDDLFGESLSSKVGSAWAYSSVEGKAPGAISVRPDDNSSNAGDDSDDDLFG